MARNKSLFFLALPSSPPPSGSPTARESSSPPPSVKLGGKGDIVEVESGRERPKPRHFSVLASHPRLRRERAAAGWPGISRWSIW